MLLVTKRPEPEDSVDVALYMTAVLLAGVVAGAQEILVLFLHSGRVLLVRATPSLLLVHLNDVILLHLQSFRRLVVIDSTSVKEKSERGDRNTNTLGVGFLQLAHQSCLLDSEVNFIGVLAHNLQLDILGIFSHRHS